MKRPPTNPLHIQSHPPQGKRLPADWNAKAAEHGGTFDRRPLEELWKNPQWSSKLNSSNTDNVIQDARLTSWKEITGER